MGGDLRQPRLLSLLRCSPHSVPDLFEAPLGGRRYLGQSPRQLIYRPIVWDRKLFSHLVWQELTDTPQDFKSRFVSMEVKRGQGAISPLGGGTAPWAQGCIRRTGGSEGMGAPWGRRGRATEAPGKRQAGEPWGARGTHKKRRRSLGSKGIGQAGQEEGQAAQRDQGGQ